MRTAMHHALDVYFGLGGDADLKKYTAKQIRRINKRLKVVAAISK